MPPRIAPTQVMIVPVAQHKAGVLEKAEELRKRLQQIARVKVDASDRMPGWKFNEHEMKGIPLRLELGPKDIEQDQVLLARRDTGEKLAIPISELEQVIPVLLEEIQHNLYQKAKEHRQNKTSIAANLSELEQRLQDKPGFIKAMWCGDQACEERIKEQTGASSRCIPFEQDNVANDCVCCGQPSKELVYWAKAY